MQKEPPILIFDIGTCFYIYEFASIVTCCRAFEVALLKYCTWKQNKLNKIICVKCKY